MDLSEIIAVEIEILPSSTTFHKGESLRIVIEGKDSITHSQIAYTRLVTKGAHSICTASEDDSHLLIPMLPPNIQ